MGEGSREMEEVSDGNQQTDPSETDKTLIIKYI